MKDIINEKKKELAGVQEAEKFKDEMKKIYKSKISNVPTPGYTGHTSIYTNPISYLNKDKILSDLERQEEEEKMRHYETDKNTVSAFYRKTKEGEKEDPNDVYIIYLFKLPYVVGYGGYRIGVKPKNYFATNFHDISLKARKEIISE